MTKLKNPSSTEEKDFEPAEILLEREQKTFWINFSLPEKTLLILWIETIRKCLWQIFWEKKDKLSAKWFLQL